MVSRLELYEGRVRLFKYKHTQLYEYRVSDGHFDNFVSCSALVF